MNYYVWLDHRKLIGKKSGKSAEARSRMRLECQLKRFGFCKGDANSKTVAMSPGKY